MCRVCAESWSIDRSSRRALPALSGGCLRSSSRRDGMKQTALASDLDLTRVAIGGLLDRMEAGGFVERRADATDGRARRVFLTKAGTKLVNKIRETVESIELEILSRIPEEDLRHAAATLLALKETLLEKIGADADAEVDSDISETVGDS